MNLLAFAVIGVGAALGAWTRWLLGLALNPLLLALPLQKRKRRKRTKRRPPRDWALSSDRRLN